MTKEELMGEIKELMQRDEDISPDMPLLEMPEWDSLTIMALVAFYSKLFGINVKAQDVKKCVTVGDLIKLAGDKVKKQ